MKIMLINAETCKLNVLVCYVCIRQLYLAETTLLHGNDMLSSLNRVVMTFGKSYIAVPTITLHWQLLLALASLFAKCYFFLWPTRALTLRKIVKYFPRSLAVIVTEKSWGTRTNLMHERCQKSPHCNKLLQIY